MNTISPTPEQRRKAVALDMACAFWWEEGLRQLAARGLSTVTGAKERDIVTMRQMLSHVYDLFAAPRTDQWIPCSERMPEEGQEVLACWSVQPRGCGVVIWQDGHWLSPDSDDHTYSAPKHWMPLPKGPTP